MGMVAGRGGKFFKNFCEFLKKFLNVEKMVRHSRITKSRILELLIVRKWAVFPK